MGAPLPARPVVGLDLGTTHTAVAWADGESVRVFGLPQLVSARAIEERPLLPSVLFAPPEGEDVADAAASFADPPWITGEHARRRGLEVPSRFVSSAKSWLSHPRADRTAPILPWGEDEPGPRVSPVDASAAVLRHVARAWDAAHPETPLASCDLWLTVPASFDEVARALTLKAARAAGLSPRLLEEPQAAFHEGIGADLDLCARLAAESATVLVVDVGGGTTDLTLLSVEPGPRVRRVAVGDHLLLGGDNMDLALAHALERTLGGDKLSPSRFAGLVLACRDGKESLLSPAPPPALSVAVLGRGSNLVGGSLRASMPSDEARELLLSGFFPACSADDKPRAQRGALVALGLPYARDPAVTRHVAAFVARAGRAPTHLFLTGGVFRSAVLRERMREIVSSWIGRDVALLPNDGPDLAVARGAVRHGLAQRGVGVSIGGGSSRSLYLGLAGDRAVCVLPKGTEPETPVQVDAKLWLLTGRRARFPLFSSHDDDRAGAVRERTDDLAPLSPVVTEVGAQSAKEVEVGLVSVLSAVGAVEVACVEASGARHVLSFDLSPPAPESVAPPPMTTRARHHDDALALVHEAFGKPDERAVKDLTRDLAKRLGERETWAADVARWIADAVLEHRKDRRRSPDHERVFLALAGYCLRPGMGAPRDPERMRLFTEVQERGLAHPKDARVCEQWLIACRRVAPGLSRDVQDDLAESLGPALGTPAKKPKNAFAECEQAVIELAGLLERPVPSTRVALGDLLVNRAFTRKDPRLWDAVGRLGARMPLYAGIESVVPARIAESWATELLREKWDALPTAPLAASRLVRATGDRGRDVSDATRTRVAERLAKAGRDDLAAVVRTPHEEAMTFEVIGEAVPTGLRMG